MKHKISTQLDPTLARIKSALPQGRFHTPSAGSSGFTGIVHLAAKDVLSPDECMAYPDGPDTPVGAVIKYVAKSDADNEVVCTQLAQAFGLNAPVVQPASGKSASLFVSPMKREKAAFTLEPFDMLAMNLIRGTNLVDLCESGRVFEFTQKQWNELLFEFGKTAVFDLFIGNFDRFVRFELTASQEYELTSTAANLGNVMLEFTPERGKGIRAAHMIDSTSLAREPKQPAVVDEDDLYTTGLFDPVQESVPVGTPPRSSHLPGGDTPERPIAEPLHRCFVNTIGGFLNGSPELPAAILASIQTSLGADIRKSHGLGLENPKVSALFSKLNHGLPNLFSGIQAGIERLTSIDFRHSPELQSTLSNNTRLAGLLRKNLEGVDRESAKAIPRTSSGRRISMHELMHGFL